MQSAIAGSLPPYKMKPSVYITITSWKMTDPSLDKEKIDGIVTKISGVSVYNAALFV